MIRINLIPEEYRQKEAGGDTSKKEKDLFSLVIKAILITLCLFFVIYVFVVYIPLKNAKKAVAKDKDTVAQLEKKYTGNDDTVSEEANLLKQANIIKNLEKVIVWSKKLNIISDSVPVQIQLLSIYLKQREEKAVEKITQKVLKGGQYQMVTKEVETTKVYHTLEIQGEVMASGGENVVGQFIDRLNGNSDFSKNFDYIKLISILSKGDDRKIFSISARFNKNYCDSLMDDHVQQT